MSFDNLIVFFVVLIAVIYLAYFILRKKGCGCGSEAEQGGCCGVHEECGSDTGSCGCHEEDK